MTAYLVVDTPPTISITRSTTITPGMYSHEIATVLAAFVDGASAVTGNIAGPLPIEVLSRGTATTAGAVIFSIPLQGSPAGTSTATHNFQTSQGNPAGSSTSAAAMSMDLTLNASSNPSSVVTAYLAGPTGIAATTDGNSQTTGHMSLPVHLAGDVTGESSTVHNFALSYGTSNGWSAVAAAMSLSGGCTADVAASSTVVGYLAGPAPVTGTAAAGASATAHLSSTINLAGTVAAGSTCSHYSPTSAGTIQGDSSAASTLSVNYAVGGSASGAATALGHIPGIMGVEVASSGEATVSGHLHKPVRMSGTAAGGSSVVYTIEALAASPAGGSTVIAAMRMRGAMHIAAIANGQAQVAAVIGIFGGKPNGIATVTAAMSKATPINQITVTGGSSLSSRIADRDAGSWGFQTSTGVRRRTTPADVGLADDGYFYSGNIPYTAWPGQYITDTGPILDVLSPGELRPYPAYCRSAASGSLTVLRPMTFSVPGNVVARKRMTTARESRVVKSDEYMDPIPELRPGEGEKSSKIHVDFI